jgi:Flagellar basal body-associated protein FliL
MATQTVNSPQSGGLKKFIFASVGVSALGLMFGFFIAAAMLPTDVAAPQETAEVAVEKLTEGGAHEATEKADADAASEEVTHGPVSVLKLEPIVTNLSGDADVWVRLEASMLFDGEAVENKDVLAAKLSQHVLAYLRTLKLTDLQANGAVNAIVQDLNEITSTVSDGQAQGILISGLVFE